MSHGRRTRILAYRLRASVLSKKAALIEEPWRFSGVTASSPDPVPRRLSGMTSSMRRLRGSRVRDDHATGTYSAARLASRWSSLDYSLPSAIPPGAGTRGLSHKIVAVTGFCARPAGLPRSGPRERCPAGGDRGVLFVAQCSSSMRPPIPSGIRACTIQSPRYPPRSLTSFLGDG